MEPGIPETPAAIVRIAVVIRTILEVAAMAIIAVGAAATIARLLRAAMTRASIAFNDTRLWLSKFLAMALEFQLAADIVQTSIAPEWPQLGKLAAIATIRTALNYFLAREMREERELSSRAPTAA